MGLISDRSVANQNQVDTLPLAKGKSFRRSKEKGRGRGGIRVEEEEEEQRNLENGEAITL